MSTRSVRGARLLGYAAIVALVPIFVARLATASGAAVQPAAASCGGAQFRQFDFFVGDWDAYDVGASTVKAHNTVTRMLDGCAIREVYRRTDGYTGESFSTYDVAHGTWHQSWVTNRGELLLLDGGMKDGSMVLSGPEPAANGPAGVIRGVWHPEENGAVRETAEHSIDGGKTWTPVFDLEFRPRRHPPP